MKVTLNGQSRELKPASTVKSLLDEAGLGKSPCAVEVNRRIVPKARHAEHSLAEGDQVEVVTLVGGG